MAFIFDWFYEDAAQATDKVAGKDGVITEVGFAVFAGEEPEGLRGRALGSVTLPPPESDKPFVEAENVTKDILLAWAKDALGADGIAEYEAKATAAYLILVKPTTKPFNPPA